MNTSRNATLQLIGVFVLCCVVQVLLEAAVFAQCAPAGSEFQVNTYIVNGQVDPSVATLSGGGFVVGWSSDGQDGSGIGVYGQIFDSSGNKVGSEFRVNTTTTGPQQYPSVAGLSGGGFVVTWESYLAGSGYGVYGQIFDSSGSKVGSEFQVNTIKTGQEKNPSVAVLDGGNFVVTWQSYSQGGVKGQVFNSFGSKVGNEFRVSPITTGAEHPSVAGLGKRGFVVTFIHSDGSFSGVYGQVFDLSGNKVGSEFRVNTTTNGEQMNQSVAGLSEDRFVVTWQSPDGNNYGVYGQIFDSSGSKVGGEFLVNTYTTSNQGGRSVATLSWGGFVVTWSSDGQDPGVMGDSGVYGQIFDSSGSKFDSEFRVNTTTYGPQGDSSVARLGDLGFVVAWQSYPQDGNGSGIYGQIFSCKISIDSDGDKVPDDADDCPGTGTGDAVDQFGCSANQNISSLLQLYEKLPLEAEQDFGDSPANGPAFILEIISTLPQESLVPYTTRRFVSYGYEISLFITGPGDIDSAEYQGVLIFWLQSIRLSNLPMEGTKTNRKIKDLLSNVDYGPVMQDIHGYLRGVAIYPRGLDWRVSGRILDPSYYNRACHYDPDKWAFEGEPYDCGYGPYGFAFPNTGLEPGKYVDITSGGKLEALKRWNEGLHGVSWYCLVKCKVEPCITDLTTGKRLGYCGGQYLEEISNASLGAHPLETDPEDRVWTSFLPDGQYELEIKGLDSGTFDLRIARQNKGIYLYGNNSTVANGTANVTLQSNGVPGSLTLHDQQKVSPRMIIPARAFKDELVLNFGPAYGLYQYDQAGGWKQWNTVNPSQMVTVDLNGDGTEEIIAAFPGYGLYKKDSGNDWQSINNVKPEKMIAADIDGDGKDELVAVFIGYGLYYYDDPGGWSLPINDVIPDAMVRYSEGMVCDFGVAYGLWSYNTSEGWGQLTPEDPDKIVAADIDGDGRDELVVSFVGWGLYIYEPSNKKWDPINTVLPDQVVAVDVDRDGKGELVVFFEGYGLYTYEPEGRIWEFINTAIPEAMIRKGKGIAVDFGAAYGLWVWSREGGWQQRNTADTGQMTVVDIDKDGVEELVVSFSGYGLYCFDETGGWQFLNGAIPEDMKPINIYP